MKAHPAADIFPMIEGDAWTSFIEDIKVNGVRHPVITHDDMILDGRNRYRACQELGIDCPTKPYEGGAPVAYVISANLQRRHMTTSQRAAIAAELANMVNGSNQHSKKEGMQNCTPSLSLEEAANLMQVSRRSAAEAKRLMRDDPAAHEAVKRGEKPAKQSAKKGSDMSGYFRIAQEEGAMPLGDAGAERRRKLKAKIEEISPGAIESKDEPSIREACRVIAQKTGSKSLDERYEEHRKEVATLKETAAQKLERLVNTEKRLLQEMFQEELHKEVVAQIPEYEKKKSEFIEERLKLSARIKGIAPQITDEDYKFLLNVLHPDRAPEDRKDRFSKAFDIVRKLDQYIQSGKAMTA